MSHLSRRRLLQAGGLGVLSLALPWTRGARAGGAYAGPLVMTVHAGGGWDPTLFCDAKAPTADIQQRLYTTPTQVGAISAAPIDLLDYQTGVKLDNVPAFFAALGSRFLILNGVDTQTNNHDTGTKHVWSGKTSEELPSLAALAAAQGAASYPLPLAYMSTGGYEATANVVQLTHVPGQSTAKQFLLPHTVNPDEVVANQRSYFSADTLARISAAQAARLDAVAKKAGSKREADAVAAFNGSHQRMAALGALAQQLPAKPVTAAVAFPALGSGYRSGELDGYLQSAELALHAFKSGLAVSASLGLGGFDTHMTHDRNHTRQLGMLCLTLRYLLTAADALGVADRLYVVVGSDFGRTPTYNVDNGKDHWNVTSMMLAGPGIRGGRVLGATDDKLRPLRVSKDDPSQVKGYDDATATRILPAHVQRALRKKVGIDAALAAPFGLPVDMPLDDMLA